MTVTAISDSKSSEKIFDDSAKLKTTVNEC